MAGNSRNRPNIYDIAKEAGVSISMVSRVVNDSGPVAVEKRERILKLLEKRQYSPVAAARSLARQDHNTFGVLLCNSGAEYSQLFANRVLAGISEWCREAQRGLMLMWDRTDRGLAATVAEAGRKVDGMLLLDVPYSAELKELLQQEEMPCVFLNEPSPLGDVTTVEIDNLNGGRLAVAHLVAKGHGRIGLITGDLRLPSGRDRYEGAMQALHGAGLTCLPEWVVDAGFHADRTRTAVREMFAEGRDSTPTALFLASDLMAFAAVDELRTMGLNVPEDVSIIGFDNSMIAPLANPPLTTVAQPLVKMGRSAAELLDQAVNGKGKVGQTLLPVWICERDSVRSPKE